MSPARFLSCAVAVALAGAVVTAAINWFVDPYLIFARPRVAGFNEVKPAVAARERLMKSYQVLGVDAKTVVLGSSRSDIGFDPRQPSWPAAAQPVYNLSIVGSGLGTNLKFLRHMTATRAPESWPRTVVVGLDFEAFLRPPATPPNVPRAAAPPSELDARFAALDGADGAPQQALWKDKLTGLLTLDALGDSVSTLIANRSSRTPLDVDANGWLSEAQLLEWTRSGGVESLFDQKNEETIRQYLHPHQEVSASPDGALYDADDVEQLLAFARQHRMKLLLVLQPSHASRLVLLTQMRYWPQMEHWKQDLTRLVAAARDQATDVSLWDFSGFTAPGEERLPEPAHRTQALHWFLDPVHFRPALGDAMVGRMFGAANALDLGVELTPETIGTDLAQERASRDAYFAQHADEVAKLDRMLCRASGVAAPAAACQR